MYKRKINGTIVEFIEIDDEGWVWFYDKSIRNCMEETRFFQLFEEI